MTKNPHLSRKLPLKNERKSKKKRQERKLLGNRSRELISQQVRESTICYIMTNLPCVLDRKCPESSHPKKRLPNGFLSKIQEYIRSTCGVSKSYSQVKADVHKLLKMTPLALLEFKHSMLIRHQENIEAGELGVSNFPPPEETKETPSFLLEEVRLSPPATGQKNAPDPQLQAQKPAEASGHSASKQDQLEGNLSIRAQNQSDHSLSDSWNLEDLRVSSQNRTTASQSNFQRERFNTTSTFSLLDGPKLDAITFNSVLDALGLTRKTRPRKFCSFWEMEGASDHDPALTNIRSDHEGEFDIVDFE